MFFIDSEIVAEKSKVWRFCGKALNITESYRKRNIKLSLIDIFNFFESRKPVAQNFHLTCGQPHLKQNTEAFSVRKCHNSRDDQLI